MISRELRDTVRRAYHFRCGYCGVHENEVGSELEIDHFCPLAAGGSDELSNLVYCCSACNRHKSDYWTADERRQLLHPWRDDWALYLREAEDGRLMALNERGELHLRRLQLNRPQLVAVRLERVAQRDNVATLAALQGEIVRIRQHRDELEIRLQKVEAQLAQPDN
ncbi:MAG: HNH endonuclease [Acidobacteria bacterium]|nr:HNH endonuclease [Acidobacteriota bacterium]